MTHYSQYLAFKGTATRKRNLKYYKRNLAPHVHKLISNSISGLVVEYIVAIDVTRVRFPADAMFSGTYFYVSTSDKIIK